MTGISSSKEEVQRKSDYKLFYREDTLTRLDDVVSDGPDQVCRDSSGDVMEFYSLGLVHLYSFAPLLRD